MTLNPKVAGFSDFFRDFELQKNELWRNG